jgi:hypothetical protein
MLRIRTIHGLLLILSLASGYAGEQARAQELDPLAAQGKNARFRKDQQWPIKLGTSGGNINDSTALFCCGGTLGALVEKHGKQFVLSNNHVLARSNLARRGEAIIQPSLVDQKPDCEEPTADEDTVATLAKKKKIRFGGTRENSVDAAIAKVVPGAVNPDGRVMKIGIPGNTPVEAEVGMRVKKSGRSSGLTHGSIVEVNLSSNVVFEPQCESGVTKTARFINMIAISGANEKPFSRGGDSGSMVFEDVDECPRPVGLLFAGNDEISVANPAALVQRAISNLKPKGEMTFVGCTTTTATSAFRRVPPPLEDSQVRGATRAMRSREQEMLSIPGIHSIGIGQGTAESTQPTIHVFVSDDDPVVIKKIPESIDGYRTEIYLTEPFVARVGCLRAD